MGYVKTQIEFIIKVEDLDTATRHRTIDEVIRPSVEDTRVKGFVVKNTEKIEFFRRGRYIE